MRIAAVQHDIVWEDRDANFARLAPQVARAVGAGAELVLLSEAFSTGFSMTPGIGEPEDGPSARFLADQAAEHGVWVGGSCPEVAADGELPYNCLVLAGPDGAAHRYRKLHPFTHAGEHERVRAGEKPVTVEIGGLRMPTSSAATGSARPVTAPSTRGTAGSSARWGSCWRPPRRSRRSCSPTSTPPRCRRPATGCASWPTVARSDVRVHPSGAGAP